MRRGYSEDGMVEMLQNMHELAQRDLRSRKHKHFYSAVQYLGALGRLEQACRARGVDYDHCKAIYDAAEAGKRGR